MEHYRTIPEYPPSVSAEAIIIRLLDGLGFRFYWATEGLSTSDYAFRPSPDCMSIEELVGHIWGLVNWVIVSSTDMKYQKPSEPEKQREQVLTMMYFLRSMVIKMSDSELAEITINGHKFWHVINGPLSDALTHVGQINSFRRLAGNPVPKANVFRGTPPSE